MSGGRSRRVDAPGGRGDCARVDFAAGDHLVATPCAARRRCCSRAHRCLRAGRSHRVDTDATDVVVVNHAHPSLSPCRKITSHRCPVPPAGVDAHGRFALSGPGHHVASSPMRRMSSSLTTRARRCRRSRRKIILHRCPAPPAGVAAFGRFAVFGPGDRIDTVRRTRSWLLILAHRCLTHTISSCLISAHRSDP